MSLLSERAAISPDATALIASDGTWSYARLLARAAVIADHIARLITGADASHARSTSDLRIAVSLPASSDYVALVHAIDMLGAALVPLNTRLTREEREMLIARVHPALHITDHAWFSHIGAAGGMDAAHDSDPTPDRAAPLRDVRLATDSDLRILSSDIQTILFTSGTSGIPKMVPITRGNHLASAQASARNLGVREGDRWLCVLPLFHTGGLSILHRAAHDGAAVVLHEQFDPAACARALRAGITLASFVPTMLARILEVDPALHADTAPRLRAVLLGGGPGDARLFDEIRRRRLPVLGTYGLSETASQSTTVPPADALRTLGSAGKPLDGMEVVVTDERGTPCPAGISGAIRLRGAMLSPGWLDAADEWEARMHNGWFETGDMGWIDEEGFLWVDARREDLIVSGGENISPAEVENVLLMHPAVREAVVVGIPDEAWGQVAAAGVVLHRPVTADDLEAHCRTHLAGYKIPRRWLLLESLPLTASGKVQKSVVRQWFEEDG